VRNVYKVLAGSPEGEGPLEDIGVLVYGKIILKSIFGKQGWRMWTEVIWLRTGTTVESCENGNGP
jgi:hypothetical protein